MALKKEKYVALREEGKRAKTAKWLKGTHL